MIKTLLTCIESKVESNRSLYGRFQLGPFQLGQGLTVANGLRRSMLSELTGVGIIAVEIKEAIHEYSTLRGIQESVFDILLNLRQIGIKSELPLNSPQIGFLQKLGPTVVRACDLKLPPSIQIVDPKQYIATISRDGCLRLKILIWQGKNDCIQPFSILFQKTNVKLTDPQKDQGVKSNLDELLVNKKRKDKETIKDFSFFLRETFLYFDCLTQQFDTNSLKNLDEKKKLIDDKKKNVLFNLEKEKSPFFYFKLDTIFAPVNNVNFAVEVDDNLEEPKDRIILEVWTNGTIKPRDAIYGGAKALIKLFGSFQTILPTGNLSNLGNISQKYPTQEKILNSLTSFNQPNQVSSDSTLSSPEGRTKVSEGKPFGGSPTGYVNCRDFDKYPQKYNFRSSYLYSLRLQTKEILTSKTQKNPSNFISFFPQDWKRYSRNSNSIFPSKQLEDWDFLQNENLKNKKAITEDLSFNEVKTKISEGNQPFLFKNTNKIEKKTFLKNINIKRKENLVLSNDLNFLDIENLDLSLRLFTLLKQANIHTLRDLVQHSRKDLLLIKGLNNKFVDQIEKKLNKIESFLVK